MYHPTNVLPNLLPRSPPRGADPSDVRLRGRGDSLQTVPRRIGCHLPVLQRNGHDVRLHLRRPDRLLSPGESRRGRRPLLLLPALSPPLHSSGTHVRFPRRSGATLHCRGATGALRSAVLLSSQTPHRLTPFFPSLDRRFLREAVRMSTPL